jgi:hypothetical protein
MKSMAQAMLLPLAVAVLFIASWHSVALLALLAAGYTLFLKDGAKIPAVRWVLFSMLSFFLKLATMSASAEAISK